MEPSYFKAYEIRTAGELEDLENQFKSENKVIYYRYIIPMANKVIILYEFADLQAQKQEKRIIRGNLELYQNEAEEQLTALGNKLERDYEDLQLFISDLYNNGFAIVKKYDIQEGYSLP